jgi:hypothetical protein
MPTMKGTARKIAFRSLARRGTKRPSSHWRTSRQLIGGGENRYCGGSPAFRYAATPAAHLA